MVNDSFFAGVPHDLRCEYYNDPVGIGCDSPRLSWKLPEGSQSSQTAWQIRIASTPEALEGNGAGSLFDERKTDGESLFIPWPVNPLKSGQRVYWKVRLWLDGGLQPTPWSRAASVETGLLKDAEWEGHWIGFKDSGVHGNAPAPYLRRGFSIPSEVVLARLYVSALGLAEFHINGSAVHPREVLLPGWTDFHHRVQSMAFDVTSLLKQGSNTLGAILGDGWYAGYLSCGGERNIFGKHTAILAQLEIQCADGNAVRIVSDGDWEGRTGPILSADLYNGETYDARLELPDWSAPLSSRGGWQPVSLCECPKGITIDSKVSEPVSKIQELHPKSISVPSPGVYIFDFGQNMVGWARLRIKGRTGQTVTLRFGEMLNPDGSIYTANLRTAKATDRYTFGGDGIAEWEPHFTYHGFRYVEITGLDEKPESDAVTGIVLHNDMRATGAFHCSNVLINQLESNIRWGLRGNFLEIPSDCPQRDERLGWSGDIQVFSKTAAYLYNVDAFLRKWMRDMRDGQTAEGAFPDIAPTFICGFGNAAWADAGVIVPWVVYRRYGDQRILQENYNAMVAWIDFQERTSENFARPETAYGDWLAIDAVIPEHAPVPSDLVGTAYFARTCGIMADVAGLLKKEDDRKRFLTLQKRVRLAFQRTFVTASGRIVGDCQTGYLLALAFDLLPTDLQEPALARLIALLENRAWHLSTGFVGTPLLCPVLTKYGRHDVAMKLLLQETYPSWLFPVKNGATTIWERWDSYTPDKGFGDVVMNSFNHYAYGAIGDWMVRAVAGLVPGSERPAYGHILFQPQLCEGLDSASAALETPYGKVSIQWQTEGKTMRGRLVVPPNSYADFAPKFEHWEVLEMGNKDAADAQNYTPIRLLPGSYEFIATDEPLEIFRQSKCKGGKFFLTDLTVSATVLNIETGVKR
ncbi:MAG: family 78 glycoside hydrolase catalytic domain [Chthoniobacteraceae bacterium]